MDARAGGDEHRGDALINRRTVHIDGGAQGQDEGGDVVLGSQLMGALLGNRQGGCGGRGGEGENHSRKSALEELHGAHAHDYLRRQGVDQDGVDNVADVRAENDQEERAQNGRALGGGDPRHVGEHADGRQGDDKLHQLLNDGVHGAHQIPAELALLARHHNGPAEEQGDHDDLEHVGVDEGSPHVAGEDVHQHGHKAVEGLGLVLRRAQLRREVREQARAHEDVGEDQADDAGDGGGAEEVGHRLHAHGAHLLHVAHGEDAVDHAQQHHGHHDELQKIHEDVAEGLQIRRGKVRQTGEVAD